MLNSLPKIALGPIIIIWVGAGTPAIIVMAVAISLIVTILENLNGFSKTDKELIIKIIEKVCKECNIDRFKIYNLPFLLTKLKYNILEDFNFTNKLK